MRVDLHGVVHTQALEVVDLHIEGLKAMRLAMVKRYEEGQQLWRERETLLQEEAKGLVEEIEKRF